MMMIDTPLRWHLLVHVCLLLHLLTCVGAAMPCNETLNELQLLVDQIGSAGGGEVMLPCGRTEISAELVLPSGVRLRGATASPGNGCQESTLALCHPNPYIVRFADGLHARTGIQGVTFDCRNLLTPAAGSAPGIGRAAVVATSHTLSGTEILISDCVFLNIPMVDQSYHAVGLANLEATVRNNWVNQSGGDALNFNSGQYIIDGNHVHDVGDGCVALNNNALGVVSNNILQRCNLAIGCGPEGSQRDNNTHPFIISNNLIEDSDYGVLLGWFGFVGGEGPTQVLVSGNDILRCRTASIRYDGNPNGTDGFLTVAANRISRAGEFPQQQPPPGSQQPSPNDGNGIVVVGIRDVVVENNVVDDGCDLKLICTSSFNDFSTCLYATSSSTMLLPDSLSICPTCILTAENNVGRRLGMAAQLLFRARTSKSQAIEFPNRESLHSLAPLGLLLLE